MDAPESGETTAIPADQVNALIDAGEEALDLAHAGREAEAYMVLVKVPDGSPRFDFVHRSPAGRQKPTWS